MRHAKKKFIVLDGIVSLAVQKRFRLIITNVSISIDLALLIEVACLYFFVGVEEHDADEREHFFSSAVAGTRQVRQCFDDRAHVVQLYLRTSDQHHLSASSAAATTITLRKLLKQKAQLLLKQPTVSDLESHLSSMIFI